MKVSDAITLLMSLLDRAQKVSALINQAHASGATDLTGPQWTQIISDDDNARLILAKTLSDMALKVGAPNPTPEPGPGVTPGAAPGKFE